MRSSCASVPPFISPLWDHLAAHCLLQESVVLPADINQSALHSVIKLAALHVNACYRIGSIRNDLFISSYDNIFKLEAPTGKRFMRFTLVKVHWRRMSIMLRAVNHSHVFQKVRKLFSCFYFESSRQLVCRLRAGDSMTFKTWREIWVSAFRWSFNAKIWVFNHAVSFWRYAHWGKWDTYSHTCRK